MNLFDLTDDSLARRGYLGIALLMVLFAPEALMPFVGFLAHEGALSLPAAILAGTLGGVVGSTLLYLFARQVGERRVRRFCLRTERFLLLKGSDLDRVLALFRRHGELIVMFGRAVPSIRSVVSLPAGLLPMPAGRFILFTAIGTGVWNIALTLAGYLLGAKWRLLEPWLGVYGAAIGVLLALFLLLFLMNRLKERLLAS